MRDYDLWPYVYGMVIAGLMATVLVLSVKLIDARMETQRVYGNMAELSAKAGRLSVESERLAWRLARTKKELKARCSEHDLLMLDVQNYLKRTEAQ